MITAARIKVSANRRIVTAGTVFRRLSVISEVEQRGGRRYFRCLCECGKTTIVSLSNLVVKNGVGSCGCLRRLPFIHGMGHTKIYKIWSAMVRRCSSPRDAGFKNYGARGIVVCERWMTFERFYSDMGNRPDGLTLERRDNEGPYSPDNCYWATRSIQARNTRLTLQLTVGGITKPLVTWAEEAGLNINTVRSRVRELGWTPEQALAEPARGK